MLALWQHTTHARTGSSFLFEELPVRVVGSKRGQQQARSAERSSRAPQTLRAHRLHAWCARIYEGERTRIALAAGSSSEPTCSVWV